MINADYHVHTNHSDDCHTPPEDAVKRAAAMGLAEIAITDHLDYLDQNPSAHSGFASCLNAYTADILRLRDEYAGKINVLLGLELGMCPGASASANALTSRYPFDFIICSTHDANGLGLYNRRFFEGKTKIEAYAEYFSQILKTIGDNPTFSVYGHFDYIERYPSYPDNTVRLADYSDVTDDIFKLLISRGHGLELNTSGYRYGLGHTNPQPEFLKRYRELGGEIITVGSDAHTADDIAANFEEAREILLDAGFRYVTRYKNMRPFMEKIK